MGVDMITQKEQYIVVPKVISVVVKGIRYFMD